MNHGPRSTVHGSIALWFNDVLASMKLYYAMCPHQVQQLSESAADGPLTSLPEWTPIFFPRLMDAMMVHFVNHTSNLCVSMTMGDDDPAGRQAKKARKMFLHTYNQSRFHVCGADTNDTNDSDTFSGTAGLSPSDRSTRSTTPGSRLSERSSPHLPHINNDINDLAGLKKFTFHILTIDVPELDLTCGLRESCVSDTAPRLQVYLECEGGFVIL